MNQPTPSHLSPSLLNEASAVLIKAQLASVSLLQRHFRMGYRDTLQVMSALESTGLVTPPNAQGFRDLMPAFQEGLPEFRRWAVEQFSGCDGGDPGTDSPSIWWFGVEHGDSSAEGPADGVVDSANSIARQRTYKYNRQSFKLLAAMHGYRVEDWLAFAEEHQPFVQGSKGFFKGNLYPYPCPREVEWTAEAQRETGFASKQRYLDWCQSHRFPAVERWIVQYRPKLMVATGITHKESFACVFFEGAPVEIKPCDFFVDGVGKRIYYAARDRRLLVVVPHLSGSPILGSNAALQATGELIATLRRQCTD